MTLTTKWILGISALVIAGIIIYYHRDEIWKKSAPAPELLDANGNRVGGQAPPSGEKCISYCLVPYPEGSQYAGYYYCNKNCGSFRTQENVDVAYVMPRTPLIINQNPSPSFDGNTGNAGTTLIR